MFLGNTDSIQDVLVVMHRKQGGRVEVDGTETVGTQLFEVDEFALVETVETLGIPTLFTECLVQFEFILLEAVVVCCFQPHLFVCPVRVGVVIPCIYPLRQVHKKA